MTDAVVAFCAVLLIGAAVIGWFVTWRLFTAARVQPYIEALTTAVVSSASVATGATLGTVLGLSRLDLLPPFPQWLNIGLLVLAILVPSVGNLAKLRLLIVLSDKPPVHVHRREADIPHLHRRADDPPPSE